MTKSAGRGIENWALKIENCKLGGWRVVKNNGGHMARPLVAARPGRCWGTRPDFMKEWSSWILHVDGVSRCEDRQCSVHETRRTTLCCTQALTSTASRSPSAFATKREM